MLFKNPNCRGGEYSLSAVDKKCAILALLGEHVECERLHPDSYSQYVSQPVMLVLYHGKVKEGQKGV